MPQSTQSGKLSKPLLMTTKGEILELAKKYYKESKSTKFIPGQTYIPAAKAYYDEKEVMALVSASLDMKWVDGDIVKRFEQEMARYLGVRFAIMTNSGSSANLLAISALTSSLFQSASSKIIQSASLDSAQSIMKLICLP